MPRHARAPPLRELPPGPAISATQPEAIRTMLVSYQHKVAFAHYPKTAGTSVRDWFLTSFPDARYLNPANPHLAVGESIQLLRLNLRRTPMGAIRHARASAVRRLGAGSDAWPHPGWRVFGVVRDPFEMLVSLYEYWRSYWTVNEPPSPRIPFMDCALRHTFRDFVSAAVVGGCIAPYEVFFGSGGPLWSRTTLLPFEMLEPRLREFCIRSGLPATGRLGMANRTPSTGRDLGRYADEIGGLMDDIHRHFRWYYERSGAVFAQTS